MENSTPIYIIGINNLATEKDVLNALQSFGHVNEYVTFIHTNKNIWMSLDFVFDGDGAIDNIMLLNLDVDIPIPYYYTVKSNIHGGIPCRIKSTMFIRINNDNRIIIQEDNDKIKHSPDFYLEKYESLILKEIDESVFVYDE